MDGFTQGTTRTRTGLWSELLFDARNLNLVSCILQTNIKANSHQQNIQSQKKWNRHFHFSHFSYIACRLRSTWHLFGDLRTRLIDSRLRRSPTISRRYASLGRRGGEEGTPKLISRYVLRWWCPAVLLVYSMDSNNAYLVRRVYVGSPYLYTCPSWIYTSYCTWIE